MYWTSLLLLIIVSLGKRGLSKGPHLQMSNIYSVNIASEDIFSYRKVDGNHWSSVISAYPVRPNATTKVEIYLQNGRTFMFGCGKKKHPFAGFAKCWQNPRYRDCVDYGPASAQGDVITVIIDLHEGKEYVEFQRNHKSMGIAYQGLGDWGDIYLIFSLHYINQRFKIIKYQVKQ